MRGGLFRTSVGNWLGSHVEPDAANSNASMAWRALIIPTRFEPRDGGKIYT